MVDSLLIVDRIMEANDGTLDPVLHLTGSDALGLLGRPHA